MINIFMISFIISFSSTHKLQIDILTQIDIPCPYIHLIM